MLPFRHEACIHDKSRTCNQVLHLTCIHFRCSFCYSRTFEGISSAGIFDTVGNYLSGLILLITRVSFSFVHLPYEKLYFQTINNLVILKLPVCGFHNIDLLDSIFNMP